MKFSEIKGKRQLKALGRLMKILGGVSDDIDLKQLAETLKGGDSFKAIAELAPILERDDFAEDIVGFVAYAKGITAAEAEECDILSEILELFSEDIELPGFLSD